MPKSIDDLKKYENSVVIKDKIFQILKNNTGTAYLLNEIEFMMIKKDDLGVDIGGKFFLYNTLRDLVSLNKIQSIISKGKEYFFIEK